MNLIEERDKIKLDDKQIKHIEELIKERAVAREKKQWQKSDEIRNMLLKENVEIIDTKEGTTWKFKY